MLVLVLRYMVLVLMHTGLEVCGVGLGLEICALGLGLAKWQKVYVTALMLEG